MTASAAPSQRAPGFNWTLPFAILLAAFALRAWQLADVPPGLTHDEAGHGHDAAHILKGVRLIYFTVGYGREPLFDYFNAGLIAGLGANPFTLRFSAVIWGMIALAATYRVGRMAFDRNTAVLALALMSFSFWPLSTSRQILRSAMLPGEMAIAAILFLKLSQGRQAMAQPSSVNAGGDVPRRISEARHIQSSSQGKSTPTPRTDRLDISGIDNRSHTWLSISGLGLAIAASLYTYIPARALWLILPLAVITPYVLDLSRQHPPAPAEAGASYKFIITSLAISLVLACLLASPLLVYLYQHPEVDQRIGTLSEPLNALRSGNPSLVVSNARDFFLALFSPGYGDKFLAYTIPGRPLFDPFTFVLFLAGGVLLVRQTVTSKPSSVVSSQTKPATAHPGLPGSLRPLGMAGWLLIYWLAIGLAPSVITGPEALTTRIIGAQPVLYILPALALAQLLRVTVRLWPAARRLGMWNLGVGIYLVAVAAFTARDYFLTWGQSADVRAAYQSTLIAMLKTIDGPTVISTVYPAAPHDPYIAELITARETRWTDARFALLLPSDTHFQFRAPSSTRPHPLFGAFIRPVQTIALRPDDLDPSFTTYTFNFLAPVPAAVATFSEAIEAVDLRWSADAYPPGTVAELSTIWQVTDAARLGPLHPPAFKTDLNLFTHILHPDGSIFLQQDRLDAPSWDWQTGDIVIQVHLFDIPPEAAPGEYTVVVGLYDRITGERLLTRDGADHIVVSPLIIR